MTSYLETSASRDESERDARARLASEKEAKADALLDRVLGAIQDGQEERGSALAAMAKDFLTEARILRSGAPA